MPTTAATRPAPVATSASPVRAVALTVLALVAVVILSIMIGANLLSPSEVWNGLWGNGVEAVDVVRGARIPRTVLGLVIGAALGLAGAIMQSVSRNPLADPQLLGVNAGASAAVVTAITFAGITQPAGYVWFALVGAAIASVAVYALGSVGGSSASPVRMVLAGTAISAALLAYVTGAMLLNPSAYNRFRYWDIGALTGRSLAEVAPLLWFVAAGLVCGLALARSLNAMALGDEVGRSLGANLGRTRLLSMVSITLLCGAATAMAGPIGFVGLAVPHLARMLVGVDHRWLLPASAALGAGLLLLADTVGRVVAWPQEVGAGLITAVVGAPVLIYLVRSRRVARL